MGELVELFMLATGSQVFDSMFRVFAILDGNPVGIAKLGNLCG
jgi:hypothetical protein